MDQIILLEAIKEKASDIHMEPHKDKIIIRFRVDGFLRIVFIFKVEEYLQIVSKIKLNSDLDITEKRRPQDGKMTIKDQDKTYDLRVSIIPVSYGEKIVIRVLYRDVFNYSLNKLNLTKTQINNIRYIMKSNNGLVFVNGPTGSGKSTTLYTMIQELNNEEINISTLEDPVEVIIDGISQMSINTKINIGFAQGLRSILRQDPDLIMLGEIRDEETAEMTVRAALTGHKVYSTIHTKDAREVFIRLEDMGVESYLIRDSIVGIISQRLIRVLCDECKKKDINILVLNKKVESYKKCGCSKCNYSGYRGRALVAAVHIIDNNTKEAIRRIHEDRDILTNNEMIDNLNDLLINGKISFDDYNDFIKWEGISHSYENVK
ncbi:GspE/PulE family protein [Clostridium celatum]|uniref:General secretory pathway protein E family protein n=1 Tax=Clostridium celatum DSM 1785 TaxID=545697 RepID=L1QHA6_9CLOT|nr:GspE/PulE family protein [Clostridium celatum]EKY26977.1 general secretory pathway protein E family protein [Clostridium celatum DSM 1785]MCE9654763.1 GspE/PulE family protein [Clostridium celatum]